MVETVAVAVVVDAEVAFVVLLETAVVGDKVVGDEEVDIVVVMDDELVLVSVTDEELTMAKKLAKINRENFMFLTSGNFLLFKFFEDIRAKIEKDGGEKFSKYLYKKKIK